MKTDIPAFNRNLHAFLRRKNAPDVAALERAMLASDKEHTRLDRIILALGLLEEEKLLALLAEHLSLSFFDSAASQSVDREMIEKLSVEYLQQKSVVPIISDGPDPVFLISDPANTQLIREIEFHIERKIVQIVAPTKVVQTFLTGTISQGSQDSTLSSEQGQQDLRRVQEHAADGPVIKFVAQKLNEAVDVGASDIHFESIEASLRVRFRVNGLLVSQSVNRALNQSSIFARLKVMAQMNVTEKRLPQDGRMNLNISGRPVDFRVSSVPTQFGESIVCRVLDPKSLLLGWDKLGFEDDTTKRIIEMIEHPSGLFLVTGPTGSGKTTTLYTALSHLRDEKRKILTVEDPIEYNLAGVEQIQVHEEIGLSFARALRSILRQDPNIIMIGEIRDSETAEIACRAALVGRMVLSTLHTNSAEGALPRLVDLGVPDYIVRDVLHGVLAQDLQIVACKDCDGEGCTACRFTGTAERNLVADLREF